MSARPMPVLPLVGSTMVAPGLSLPWRSAVSIMLRQIRSLTDPPGLNDSNLAQTSASFFPGSALSLTTGVEPIRSRTDLAPFKFVTGNVTRLSSGGEKFDLSLRECYILTPTKSMKSLPDIAWIVTQRNVCVLFPGALGDFICFAPTLALLAQAAHPDVYTRSEFADLVPEGTTVHSLEQ